MPTHRIHGDDTPRLVAHRPSWPNLVRAAFDPIRRYGHADAAVMTRVLDVLKRIAVLSPPDRLASLRQQADAALAASEASGMDALDLSAVKSAYEDAITTMPNAG